MVVSVGGGIPALTRTGLGMVKEVVMVFLSIITVVMVKEALTVMAEALVMVVG